MAPLSAQLAILPLILLFIALKMEPQLRMLIPVKLSIALLERR